MVAAQGFRVVRAFPYHFWRHADRLLEVVVLKHPDLASFFVSFGVPVDARSLEIVSFVDLVRQPLRRDHILEIVHHDDILLATRRTSRF